MKNIFTITFLILAAIVAVGQDINDKRLSEIDAEIAKAIANDSTELAVILSKEKELRQDIRVALKYNDYERALKLKRQIDQLYNKNSQSDISVADSILTKTVGSDLPKSKEIFIRTKSLKSGFYVEGITALGIFRDGIMSPGGGFSFGVIRYFNIKNTKLQFGLNGRSSFAYYFLDEILMIDLFQIGPHFAIPFGKNAAFEYGLFCGMVLEPEIGDNPNPWFDMGTLVSLRISNFAIGLDCNLNVVSDTDFIYNNQTQMFDEYPTKSSIVRFGLKVGGKF